MTIFTIAVMIYNVERFLPMCLESIIKQKGDDIEILLIDDGSLDSSGDICDKYAKGDSRIRVIHQQNRGVAAARNVAIQEARGKWLIQVDGDDALLANAIKYGREYIDEELDWLQFDAVEFEDIILEDQWEPKGYEMVISGELIKEYHMQLIDRSKTSIKFPTYNLNPAWGKIWNIDFIRRNCLSYNNKVKKGEGTLFTFTASYVMNKIKIIPKPIYGYRINRYSIMHRFSPDILENQTIQIHEYKKVIEANGEDKNNVVKEAIQKRGLYLVENAIQLGISHPDCKWNVTKRREWVEQLCSLQWVRESVVYAQNNSKDDKIFKLILRCDYEAIIQYCTLLRIRKVMGTYIKKSRAGNCLINIYRKIRYKRL